MDHTETAKLATARGPALTPSASLCDTLVASIEARLGEYPDGRIWSWGLGDDLRSDTRQSLWLRSAAIAGGLASVEATAGRPVVLLIRDAVDFVAAFWACIRTSAMAVPLTGLAADLLPDRRDAALRDVLCGLDRPVILIDATFTSVADVFRSIEGVTVLSLAEAEATSPLRETYAYEGPVCLIPTSGSTGRTKLVTLSEPTILNRYFSAPRPGSIVRHSSLTLLPFDGISGVGIAFASGKSVAHLSMAAFTARPLALFDAIEYLRVDNLGVTNSLAVFLLSAAEKTKDRWDLASLELVGVGAEPVVLGVMRRFREELRSHGATAVKVLAGYGMTETGTLGAGADIDRSSEPNTGEAAVVLGGCARGTELRIADENGATLHEGEIGEVQALCPEVIFSGYWGEPETTRAGFTSDGWWRTGDLGSLRDGLLTLHGRSKEIVIFNGKKHSLAEIDTHLQSALDPNIRAYSCVVHRPEEGEQLVIVLVDIDHGPDVMHGIAVQVRAIIGARFGIRAYPLAAPDLTAIPVTGAGKIRRLELAQRVQAGAFASSPVTEAV